MSEQFCNVDKCFHLLKNKKSPLFHIRVSPTLLMGSHVFPQEKQRWATEAGHSKGTVKVFKSLSRHHKHTSPPPIFADFKTKCSWVFFLTIILSPAFMLHLFTSVIAFRYSSSADLEHTAWFPFVFCPLLISHTLFSFIKQNLMRLSSLRHTVGLTAHDRTSKFIFHPHRKTKPPTISSQFQVSPVSSVAKVTT